MKRALVISPLVALLILGSCKELPSTTPNAAVVIDAEKTLRISKDTFDTFLKIEYLNQALVKSKFPQIHTFAEYIRKNAPTWLSTANDLKNQYKHGTGSLNALLGALSVLKQNTSQAQTYTTQLQP